MVYHLHSILGIYVLELRLAICCIRGSKSKKWLLPLLVYTTQVWCSAHRDFSQVIGSFAMMRFVFLSGDCSSEHRVHYLSVCVVFWLLRTTTYKFILLLWSMTQNEHVTWNQLRLGRVLPEYRVVGYTRISNYNGLKNTFSLSYLMTF